MIRRIKCFLGIHKNILDRDKGLGVAKSGFLVHFICRICRKKSIIVVRN